VPTQPGPPAGSIDRGLVTVTNPPVLSPPAAPAPSVAALTPAAPAPAAAPAPGAGHPRDADGPVDAALVVGAGLLAGLAVWAWPRRRRRAGDTRADQPVPPAAFAGVGLSFVGLLLVAGLGSDVTTYKVGLVAITFVGVLGLHLLVNQAGELSLGHASFVGLPALLSAQVAAHAGWSPLACLPFGLAFGAAFGLLVGLPALRARGVQVALVTLAAGVFVEAFLFRRPWVRGGPDGLAVRPPTLLGHAFSDSRALMPVLAVVVALASLLAVCLLGSRTGRALSFVRAAPDAAAAAGIPVGRYRLLAFALAGSFAGLSGSLYVMWVDSASPDAFPLTLGFQFLVIAVFAGRGGLAGLAVSTAFLRGGQYFLTSIADYLNTFGPLLLVANLALYRKGVNGSFRDTAAILRNRRATRAPSHRTPQYPVVHTVNERVVAVNDSDPTAEQPRTKLPLRPGLLVGAGAIVAGFTMIVLAWYHTGNTDDPFVQNQEIVSGGIGGIAVILVGVGLLIRDALLHGRYVLAERSTAPTVSEPAGTEPITGPLVAPAPRRRPARAKA
jgi:branched-chain amino acid transport system permease protein